MTSSTARAIVVMIFVISSRSERESVANFLTGETISADHNSGASLLDSAADGLHPRRVVAVAGDAEARDESIEVCDVVG